jgi:RimJ/RimL family protein N-acetyltransferase
MNVSLRKITLQDTSNIVKWRNSEDVRKNLFTQDDLTAEMHINWFHSKVETGLCAQYIIEVVDGLVTKDVGTTFLKGIDRLSQEGEFGIFIGDGSFRGKHLATTVTKEMVRIGFQELGLKRIWLSVFEDNVPAIKAYEKAGFKTINRRVEKVRGKNILYMEKAKDNCFTTLKIK